MNTPNSFFLPKHKSNINTEEDLLDFLQKLFPSYIPVETQDSIFKSMTTLLFHVTGPISLSALELFLGSFFDINSSRVKLYRYVKKGSFLSHPLKSTDLSSKVTSCSPWRSSSQRRLHRLFCTPPTFILLFAIKIFIFYPRKATSFYRPECRQGSNAAAAAEGSRFFV